MSKIVSISILIPVKNGERYFVECLESILAQSYRNWEAIIINDHSVDDTQEIIEKYKALDERITSYQNEGNGIIPALRLALKKSSGNYITRMDADDIMAIDKLHYLFLSLKKHGQGFISTNLVKYFSGETLGQGYLRYENWINDLVYKSSHYSEIYKECPIPSPSWMMHKKDLKKIGSFKSNLYPEDYDLIFRCYLNRIKPIGIKRVLHYWRDYTSRASRTDQNYADNRFINLKLHYFLKIDYDNKKQLVLWGAGRKAKTLSKLLIKSHLSFNWVCNNKNKIGHIVYGKKLLNSDTYLKSEDQQYIIAVAQKNAQKNILSQLKSQSNFNPNACFWFC